MDVTYFFEKVKKAITFKILVVKIWNVNNIYDWTKLTLGKNFISLIILQVHVE